MMQSQKYQQLIDRLLSKTDLKELDWKETADPNTYQISFPNYSIMLTSQNQDVVGYPYYSVRILNSEGKQVDFFNQYELGDYAQRLADLYQRARRQALGAEKALDELLSELG